MEEVDSIIFHFLNQLDNNISKEIKSVGDIPVELIISSVSKCLKTINPFLKVPETLPQGVSHRIEVAAQIAGYCKDLGYKNDVGYQTFLYSNESDLRQVFMFLIEHLPSEGKQVLEIPTIKSVLLQKIAKIIDDDLNTIWIPQSCLNNKIKCSKNITQVNIPIQEEQLMKSLQKINKYRPQPKVETQILQYTQSNENQDSAEIKQSLRELKEISFVLLQKLNTIESERNFKDFEYSQAQKSYEQVDAELKNIVHILNSIGLQTSEIDSAVDVMAKVENNLRTMHVKSEGITSKTLSLKLEIDKYKSQNKNTQSERSQCHKTLITLKENAKALKEEINAKELIRDQLKKDFEKIKGGNKRSVYTKRILEIISNVDKQNLEITKILDDTREIQKEINSLEGQLDRCFSIADETLFNDAKKDDEAKKAYKLLALLHSECNTIVSLINETGTLAREIVDLEDNIKAEKTKRTEDTLEKIKLDLTRMQEESV